MRLRILAFLVLFSAPLAAADGLGNSAMDAAFRDMYNLEFDAAHRELAGWQSSHPADPLCPVADAAAYLFAEFNRLHILEVEFFTNDKSFETKNRLAPDPALRQKFFASLDRGSQLASQALSRNPNDAQAMFASVLALGLRGDYVALIEKRQLQGLSNMKQARELAERLLALDPARYDAYLAVGVENYLLSLKPAPLRWMLRMGGAQTDRSTGIDRLRLTAEKGHYLRPFARLLLAVAALRDNDKPSARALLSELAQQFPQNPLYGKELRAIQ
ncbi:MAG TPA: hypothetical protein VE998_04185 [Terriglobales bacterium]|nr:hypothetical protein [Terriglobales bacterium]